VLHRLATIRRLQDDRIPLQIPKNAVQRFSDQLIIIDHQDFHPRPST
jgi:hypothetical protein